MNCRKEFVSELDGAAGFHDSRTHVAVDGVVFYLCNQLLTDTTNDVPTGTIKDLLDRDGARYVTQTRLRLRLVLLEPLALARGVSKGS